MLKFRTIFMAVMAAGILVSLPLMASAQLPQSVVDQLTPKYRRLGPCRDPWVTIAINDVFANTRTIQGVGDWGECAPIKYGTMGSWSSYADLYQSVKTVFNNTSGRLTITKETLPSGNLRVTTQSANGKFVHNDIVSHDGGTLLASDGATLIIASAISQGGGNILVNQGSNVVGPGGASAISQGGGNGPKDGGKLLTNNGGTMTVSKLNLLAVSDNEMRVYLGGSVLILKK
jgi:hypothetical protein